MSKYEDQIIEAIDLVVKKSLEKASFDKTISCTVVGVIDSGTGQYEVKYQDSSFYAFASENKKYSKGAMVYVLIPGNDFDKKKTILGLASDLGEDYISVNSIVNNYEINGSNFINSFGEIGLHSYKPQGDYIFLYNKDSEENKYSLNYDSINVNMKKSSSIIISASVRTNLAIEQQSRGSYGIMFALNFKSNSSDEVITRYFYLNEDNISGNPYKLSKATTQNVVFDIGSENFIEIQSIVAYSKGFPHGMESGYPEDIFIKNLSLCGASLIQNTDAQEPHLSILTPQDVFITSNSDKISLRAQLKKNGSVIDAKKLDYYWFKENLSIDGSSEKYSQYGKIGWELLDSNDNILLLGNSDVNSSNIKFKSVVVYNDKAYSKEITIYNKISNYNVILSSSNGTRFFYDNGETTLTCNVNGVAEDQCAFVWNRVSNTGMIEVIEGEYGSSIKVSAKEINKIATYKCGVKHGNNYLGTASITLTNDYTVEGTYSLVINGGNISFKYDENGLAPTAASHASPQVIEPLTFSLYDNLGNLITGGYEYYWTVPTEATLLNVKDVTPTSVDEEKKIAIYDTESLPYEIARSYNNAYNNNTIVLTVKYKNLVFTRSTEFFFLKEGQDGSNGTDYVVKIVPNVDGEFNAYPMITFDRSLADSEAGILNFTPKTEGDWFKVRVYENGVLIYEGSGDGKTVDNNTVTVKWEKLRSAYDGSTSEACSFAIVDNKFSTTEFHGYGKSTDWPTNIVKAIVKVGSLSKNIYATASIITRSVENFSKARSSLKFNTGFLDVVYSNERNNPKYHNKPFEIDGLPENALESVISWEYVGRQYKSKAWEQCVNLKKSVSDEYFETGNKRLVTPSSNWDGYCISNAIVCRIGTETLHIPIHFMIDRYSNGALNDWDGNTIETDNDGGMIISPLVGAGKKNADNTFTGVIMGTTAKAGKENTGLFAYSKGERSFFLDADDGSATFGTSSGGQIIIDPNSGNGGSAIIKSGNYSTSNKAGMQIDLVKPEIRWGNGQFVVDKDGKLSASGVNISGVIDATSGTIGGWTIDKTRLYGSGTIESNGTYSTILSGGNLTFKKGATELGSLIGNNATRTMYSNTTGNTITNNVEGLYLTGNSNLALISKGGYLGTIIPDTGGLVVDNNSVSLIAKSGKYINFVTSGDSTGNKLRLNNKPFFPTGDATYSRNSGHIDFPSLGIRFIWTSQELDTTFSKQWGSLYEAGPFGAINWNNGGFSGAPQAFCWVTCEGNGNDDAGNSLDTTDTIISSFSPATKDKTPKVYLCRGDNKLVSESRHFRLSYLGIGPYNV